MEFSMESQNQEMLEGFLQDLILHIDRQEDVEILIEVLETMKRRSQKARRDQRITSALNGKCAGRFDIFKMDSDRIARIGFVKGADNAKMILPGLNSIGITIYFLNDANTG